MCDEHRLDLLEAQLQPECVQNVVDSAASDLLQDLLQLLREAAGVVGKAAAAAASTNADSNVTACSEAVEAAAGDCGDHVEGSACGGDCRCESGPVRGHRSGMKNSVAQSVGSRMGIDAKGVGSGDANGNGSGSGNGGVISTAGRASGSAKRRRRRKRDIFFLLGNVRKSVSLAVRCKKSRLQLERLTGLLNAAIRMCSAKPRNNGRHEVESLSLNGLLVRSLQPQRLLRDLDCRSFDDLTHVRELLQKLQHSVGTNISHTGKSASACDISSSSAAGSSYCDHLRWRPLQKHALHKHHKSLRKMNLEDRQDLLKVLAKAAMNPALLSLGLKTSGSESLEVVMELLEVSLAQVDETLSQRVEIELFELPPQVKQIERRSMRHRGPEHRQCCQALTKYLARALPYAHTHQKVKHNVRRILGLTDWYTSCIESMRLWKDLLKACEKRLHFLGNALEFNCYHRRNLRGLLGSYAPRIDSSSDQPISLRQSLIPQVCSPASFTGLRVAEELEREYVYVHFLRLVAAALNPAFQAAVAAALQGLVPTDAVQAGKIKSYERIVNKMFSRGDHRHATKPRPARNIDVVRCIASFEDPKLMLEAFDALPQKVGRLLKFKNGMAWPASEAKQRYNLRIVIATVEFSHPLLQTAGQLCRDPDVQRIWNEHLTRGKIPYSESGITWRRRAQTAMRWLQQIPRDTVVTMPCEIQLVLREYEHARNAMHEVYKVVRAVSVDALAKDYARFGREHRANIRFEQAGSSELKLACRDGDVQTVRRILSRDSSGCNRTGLAYIAVGHELQDKEAALARGESASALNLRTFWPHRLVDVDVEVSNDTAAALFVACEYSQLECVEEILASAPNLSRSELDEALVPACRSRPTNEGDESERKIEAVVHKLLSAKADPLKTPEMSALLVVEAASRSHLGALRVLLTHKADVNASGFGGKTALYIASKAGHIDAVELLLQNKADLSKREQHRRTPLSAAAHQNHVHIVHALLQTAFGKHGPSGSAPRYGFAEIGGHEAIFAAAVFNHTEALNLILDASTSSSGTSVNKPLPLAEAATNNCAEALQLLTAAKGDVNARNKAGRSLLFLCAQHGSLESARVLLESKASADCNETDVTETAVHKARRKGHSEIVKLLIAAKARV